MALGLGKSRVAVHIKELLKTSSLNNYVLCDLCGKKERNKADLVAHLKECVANRTCTWCNIAFKNRGNLFSHISHIHGKKVSQITNLKHTATATYVCTVCPKAYTQITNLKYHIRREHYNMIAKITEGEKRDLNEVWLERVLNSDAVLEIKKVKLNMYLMKKASKNHSLEISESKDSIDLSPLYPTHIRKQRVWCDLCKKTYYQRDFKKHIQEIHENVRRHECNNCHKKFQRAYQYLQHHCTRKTRWRKKIKCVENITIDD